MRPYLTIIRDSFHEALVSRVLWILLAITTLVLLGLAPLGLIEQAGSYLSDEDFLDRPELVKKLVAQGKANEPSPGQRIWKLLDPSLQRSLEQPPSDRRRDRVRFRRLADALREMIAKPDFYRDQDWANVTLPSAARQLHAKGLKNLPQDELARFNRFALNGAFPDEIAPIPPKQVQLAYFHWELGLTLPVEPEQLFPAMNQLIVTTLSLLLGVAGVFVAVMVTASMIPQAFEAGSIDLLLSRPINRSWLFLAKFVGGCGFIAINAAYLIGGLWLLLGLRFGLWNERLLLAIPLYLFLFAIYYGVSSLAGVVWRNAIVSVVMAVLFWFVCWSLGTATGLVEQLSLNPRRLVTIVPAGEDLIAVDFQGRVFRWDELDADWQEIFIARDAGQLPFMFASRLVGPIYNPAGERIIAFRLGTPGFSPLSASTRLLIGKRADDWRRTEGVNVPDGAMSLLRGPGDELLTTSSRGIYRLEGDLEAKQQDINFFGMHIPLPQRGGRFVNVARDVQLRSLQSADIEPDTAMIALFDGYRLALYERDADGAYHQARELSFEVKLTGQVAMAGGAVFLALDGEVRRYDLELKLVDTIESVARSLPGSAAVSRDGRLLAIVYRDGTLWLYDAHERKPFSLSILGQGDVSAVAFEGSSIYVADRLTRVTKYDLDARTTVQQWHGASPLAEKIYRYALHPLYTVFPKPSQLNRTVMVALTSNDNTPGAIRLDNNNAGPQRLDVWGPMLSNSIFLAAVLVIACVYIHRKDF